MIIKFSKSYKGYANPDSVFYDIKENKKFIRKLKSFDKLYKKQPIRKNCKLCKRKIDRKKITFTRNLIRYYSCKFCGQLNGEFQDTKEYNDSVYIKDGGFSSIYGNVNKKKFIEKANNIYMPKAEFLIEVLNDNNVNYKNLKCADFGSGSGHLLYALLKKGFKDVIGFEVSKEQVMYSNKMIGSNIVFKINQSEIKNILKKTDANIVSSIFHLEHIVNPYEFLECVKNNKNIEYLFLSVPLYSFGVVFELLFEKVMPRILGECHTHLFTNKSLNWLENEFKFKLVGQWWFGGDIFDLHRTIAITLKNKMKDSEIYDDFNKKFHNVWDEIQSVVDKKKYSSEVHLVYKVN